MRGVGRALWGERWGRPSHRGRYVGLWGFIHLMFAIILAGGTSSDPALSTIVNLWVPQHVWAAYALIAGLWSLTVAFRDNASSVPPFVLLSTLIGARAIGHVAAAILVSDASQLASAAMWLAITATHMTVARWPNPQPVRLDPIIVSEAIIAILADKIVAREGETDREHLLRIVEEDDR